MNNAVEGLPDHNSLGKASGIIGILALIFSFIPIVGFVSWILGPLAILFGFIALRKKPRSMAIVGLITGAIALVICFWWITATESVGQAMGADTFNTTGETRDLSDAPIVETTVRGLWNDLESNKVAAGQKYGGSRIQFNAEKIADFGGDVDNPSLQFIGKSEQFMNRFVSASFEKADGEMIGKMSKGSPVSFVCTGINETFGEGYNLNGCKLN